MSGPPSPTPASTSYRTCCPSVDLDADVTAAVAAVSGAGWRWPRCCWSRHDVLVLDEPTNHLDVEVIGWLADHLTVRRPRALVRGQPRSLVPGRGVHADVGGARRRGRRIRRRVRRLRAGARRADAAGGRNGGAAAQPDAQGAGVAAARPAGTDIETEVPDPGRQRADRQRAAAARFACAATLRDQQAGQGRVRPAPGTAGGRPIG